ncbi:MAG: phospholipase D family protein [Actinomycetota bacterium]
MEARFIAQPFADDRDLRDFMNAIAADDDLTHLDVVVAWAKRSGLSRLRKDLEAIGARAGETRLIVGIDEGGATRQGLELARELFDVVHVFHDRGGGTFHPKVYAARGESAARLLVGSHNATAGGVYFNHEAGIECLLTLPDDAVLLDSVTHYVDRLYADTAVCMELTDDLLAELIANPRYRVRDEDTHPRPTGTNAPEELDDSVDIEDAPEPPGASPSVFGRSAEQRKKDPGTGLPKKAAAKATGATKKAAAPPPSAGSAPPAPTPLPAAVAVKRWFKRLASSDAQHPPGGQSNVTGVLRLVQAGHPIDQTSYFRQDFFAPLPWAATPKPRGLFEQTVVPFAVRLNGADAGMHNLRVDDAAYREAGQGNHTSVLHWDGLGPTLAATDYTGNFVVLERLADGTYRLEITPHDPGAAAFIA